RRLAHGQGLTADFVWNFIEAPQLAPLPVPSHRFWMPLTTVVQAAGIATLEPLLGAFRSAQAAIVLVAAFIPAATYAAARAGGAAGLAPRGDRGCSDRARRRARMARSGSDPRRIARPPRALGVTRTVRRLLRDPSDRRRRPRHHGDDPRRRALVRSGGRALR